MADRGPLNPEEESAHWEMSCRLALILVVVALGLVLAVCLVGAVFDSVSVFGLPLGYAMAGLGVPLILTLLLFSYEARQEAIDERHGAAED